MKKILRYTFLYSFNLIIINFILHNLSFSNLPKDLIIVAFILTIFEIFIKPILKILLLPINLLTLGLFRIIINTLGLYLAVFVLDSFIIQDIHLASSNFQGFIIPPLDFTRFFAYLVTSLLLSLIFNLSLFIIKK